MTPKAVLSQWQIELREKFNLNWPIYDGKQLVWHPIPGSDKGQVVKVSNKDWHKEPFVLVSSHLMRRRARQRELLDDAEPWDLVILDEAHHARRSGIGAEKGARGANRLLQLMRQLRKKTAGLVMLTATPMQVSPKEVWDLLELLDVPVGWDEWTFETYFHKANADTIGDEDLEWLAQKFRAVEDKFGETDLAAVMRYADGSRIRAGKVLRALRDKAKFSRSKLKDKDRETARRILLANSPVGRLVSRHTRELLRSYFKAGKIKTSVADRKVTDRFIELTTDERRVYESVEDYISSTYNAAEQGQKHAVGFVMTTYRRRLASSYYALSNTLQERLRNLNQRQTALGLQAHIDDVSDNTVGRGDVMDADDVAQLKMKALQAEEIDDLKDLLTESRKLPTDTKSKHLVHELRRLRQGGHKQVIVFTQYTDTMDFLRKHLATTTDLKVLCFSGRGGELRNHDGSWRKISRDEIKRRFRQGYGDVLVCTDAAAEGLNFQFCGALINYDMPWNPMRVEQRIGRIDRLGQEFATIELVNLHYKDTVETDVYLALRDRIGLFTKFVGKLQPILSKLSQGIQAATLVAKDEREVERGKLVQDVQAQVEEAEEGGFDIDAIVDADLEEPMRPAPPYDLSVLGELLRHPELLPPGLEVTPMGANDEFHYKTPELPTGIRVTTDASYYEDNPGSVELWSPGSSVWPEVEKVAPPSEVRKSKKTLRQLVVG